MRLKQLLGVTISLLVLCGVAAGANAELRKVAIAGQADMTSITLQTSGSFTHNEYRPADNLLLVDLSGVHPLVATNKVTAVNRPGIVSYRVLSYQGANGARVARVEFTLEPGAQVSVREPKGGLELRVRSVNAAAAPAVEPTPEPRPVTTAQATAPPAPATRPSGSPVEVRHVGVRNQGEAVQVEIVGTAMLQPKPMVLKAPDRLVLDFSNVIPAAAEREWAVKSDTVKGVRMGRFSAKPPVTRVVIDTAGKPEYELHSEANIVTVTFRNAVSSRPATQPVEQPVVVAETPQPQPVAVAANPPAPTPKPVAEVKPAPQPVVIAQTPVPSPVPQQNTAVDPAMETRASASLHESALNMALMQAMQTAQPQGGQQAGPARPRYNGEPISVNFKDVDVRDFFRLIHEISGLNVVLDPNVKGTLTLVLDDVPWDQALDIVLKNNSLDRQLEGNVLRIATIDTLRKEADARRAQAEAEALAVPTDNLTIHLNYAKAKDVAPTIKKFLSARGDVVSDDRTNALIISDIPAKFAQVQALVVGLDTKTPEVEIEARVVAATRSFARDIGTQLGFGWGNNPTAVGGATSVGSSPAQVGVASAPLYFVVPTNSIPLFSNLPAIGPTSGITFNNTSNNYRLDFVLTMAESRGLLKILSRPRIVTQNNIQAQVQQGVRVPVVTAAQLGGPPTVTYIPALLKMTVTPQITAEGTIFLNVDVENTTPDFGRAINGNPTLVTQQATTQVLVTNGGTVVIGGVIQTQNSVSTNQVPLLGDIPVLGNLFKRRVVSTSTQELIFFITPKIVQT